MYRLRKNRTDHALFKSETHVEKYMHGTDTASQLPTTERQSGTAVYGPEPFFNGFEAAMFSFNSAKLSQPHCCAGAIG